MATNDSTNKVTNIERVIYPELSYKIVGILFKVHNELGSGYQEKYYSRAIEQEFVKEGIKFDKEVKVCLKYNGNAIGRYFIDFIIENKIVLEIKTTPRLGRKDFKQISTYLLSRGFKLGIIVNFQGYKLDYHRVLNPQNKHS